MATLSNDELQDLAAWVKAQETKIERYPGLSDQTRDEKANDLEMLQYVKTLINEKL